MIDERRKTLLHSWLEEDESSREWRNGLSKEERELVESWDRQYSSGVYQLCLDILHAESQV